jgi:RNA polymerase sigma-70 factor (ECF subfamily)
MDEREAVGRLKRGDVGGLEPLVREHYTRAVRAAYLIVRDRALAEDVVQGSFVRAYEKIDQFDADRPFGPWFAKVVVNHAVAAARRREQIAPSGTPSADDLLGKLADPAAGPHQEAEEAEERRRVWAALEKLPPAQRAVVVQRYYLGLSEAEMADKSESPPGTIKSRLHAARKSLSELLRPPSRAQSAPAATERSVPVSAATDPLSRRNNND